MRRGAVNIRCSRRDTCSMLPNVLGCVREMARAMAEKNVRIRMVVEGASYQELDGDAGPYFLECVQKTARACLEAMQVPSIALSCFPVPPCQ